MRRKEGTATTDHHHNAATTTAGKENTEDHTRPPNNPNNGESPAGFPRRVRPTDRAYHLARVRAGFSTTIGPDSARRLARLLAGTDNPTPPSD